MPAYPTESLQKTLEKVDTDAIALKEYCESRIVTLARGAVDAETITSTFSNLRSFRATLLAAAGKPGIVPFARNQKNDQSLDVVAAFNSIIAAIDAATQHIATAIPTHQDGGRDYLLVGWLGADNVEHRTFSKAETATLRTRLQAIADTINTAD